MAYRDEEDAQRARIDELEKKLAAAQGEIAVLKGEKREGGPTAVVEHSRISGGPTRYEREVRLPFAIDELGYEAIASVLRTRLKLNASQVGRTLTVPHTFTLERDGDGTRVRLVADWRGMPAGVVATGLMAGFFGAIMSGGAMADILTHGLGWHHSLPVDVGFAATVVTLATSFTFGAAGLMRRSTRRTSTQLLADYEGTFATILALAEEHRVREVPKTRVADDAGAEASADEVEAAASEVSQARSASPRS